MKCDEVSLGGANRHVAAPGAAVASVTVRLVDSNCLQVVQRSKYPV
jgi:hypothetical protein